MLAAHFGEFQQDDSAALSKRLHATGENPACQLQNLRIGHARARESRYERYLEERRGFAGA